MTSLGRVKHTAVSLTLVCLCKKKQVHLKGDTDKDLYVAGACLHAFFICCLEVI